MSLETPSLVHKRSPAHTVSHCSMECRNYIEEFFQTARTHSPQGQLLQPFKAVSMKYVEELNTC